MAGGKYWDIFKMEKLEDCVGKEVDICVKESTAYFSGRNCDLDCLTDQYSNLTLLLEEVSSEMLVGIPNGENSDRKELHFLKRTYGDLSIEAKDLIRRYKCVEQEIVSVKYKDEVIYKHGKIKT